MQEKRGYFSPSFKITVSFLSLWSKSLYGWKVTTKLLQGIQTQLLDLNISWTVLQSKHFQPLKWHVNPSVIQFPCVPRHVAAMWGLLHFTSTLMCFPEHQWVLFILVICHNSANTPTTKTTHTATHQSGCKAVQTRQATRRLNTAHGKQIFQPSCAVLSACLLWEDTLRKVFYF